MHAASRTRVFYPVTQLGARFVGPVKHVARHRHFFHAHEHPKSEAAPCQVLTDSAGGISLDHRFNA